MINIEIKGVQFSNKGAELMLVAILEQLDQHFDDYHITLSPGRFLPYQKRAKLGAWQKLSFRRGSIDLTGFFAKFPASLLNFLKRYGIVTEKNIDVILDASGFAYGDQWGVKSLKHTLNEIKRYKKHQKKYIFLPQALGPFELPITKNLAEQVFSQANLVFPRDDSSLQAINALIENNNHIFQSPDFTCLVEPSPALIAKYRDSITKNNAQTLLLIPNNKMVSRFNHLSALDDEKNYINFFIATARHFQQQGWNVVLLNHEGQEDQLLCQQIAQQLNNEQSKQDVIIKAGLSAIEIKACIGAVHAVVSSRFHGCVSALTQGIPCLATSWSHKYQMLFKEYSVADNVLDFKMPDDELYKKLDHFNQELKNQSLLCLTHAQEVKNQSKQMWKQVFLQIANNNKS